MKAGYRRTASTLKHKQDPAKAERAGKVLANLKAKAAAGSVVLYYLDECGFSPTLPVGYSWSLPGQRKLIRYEAPQGRRVNALAAYRPYGRSPRLEVFTAERTWNSYDLIGFLKALPWSKCPRVVVLDNASFHTSKVIRAARKGLTDAGIYLYFLPPYSPELNRIEPVFRQVKHQEIPQRSYTTRSGLREAVETGFTNYGRKLRPKSQRELRPAGRSSRSSGRGSPPAAASPSGGRCSTGSSSGCGAAASGRGCPSVRPQEHRPRLVPALGRGGHLREDLGGAGRRVRRDRRGAVAVAERPTRCWARPGAGGKRRAGIRPIAASRGPRRASWSTATAARRAR